MTESTSAILLFSHWFLYDAYALSYEEGGGNLNGVVETEDGVDENILFIYLSTTVREL